MKKFIKKSELDLVNGGYLSVKGEEVVPVTNDAFVAAQERAHYIVTFAKHAKGKVFECPEVASIEDVKAEVAKEIAGTNPEYVSAPRKVKQKLTEKLKAEAMSFMEFTDESSKVAKINDFLQEFNILKEFEEFGLFFDEGIVKLNKIYTVEDVTKAVKETIDLLQ